MTRGGFYYIIDYPKNKEVGLIQPNQYTLVQLFDFRKAIEGKGFFDAWCAVAPVILTLLGLLLIAVLEWKRVKGSVMIVMGFITVVYYLTTWQLPSFDMGQVGQSFVDFAEVGLFGAFGGFTVFAGGVGAILNSLMLVLTFCLVDMFDTIGTLYATGEQAGMMVGSLMLGNFAKVNMKDISEAVPAFLALIMMPLTYSISNGIAIGAIAYIVIALLRGKYTKKDIVLTIVAILFIIRFFTVSI